MRIAEHLTVEPHTLPQIGDRGRSMGDQQRAVLSGIAGDVLSGDQLADGLDRLDADRDRAARGLDPPAPDPILEPDLPERDEREAAIAAGGAPADRVRLEDDGVEAVRFGQPTGSGEPGVAAADHGHVGASIAFERLDAVRVGIGRRRPVRRDVGRAVHDQRER